MMAHVSAFPEIHFADPFIRGLACAALSPGLQNILLFDANPETVQWAAAILQHMRAVVSGTQPAIYTMGVTENDDSLWGYLRPKNADNFLKKLSEPILCGGRKGYSPQIIAIPDLTRLNLAATRAALMLMDTPAVALERHGQHEVWMPDISWVAACPRRAVGKISPHLLDRFALRLTPPVTDTAQIGPIERLRTRLENLHSETLVEHPLGALPEAVEAALHQAGAILPEMPVETGHYLLATYRLQTKAPFGVRRDIALGRLAVAVARLDGASKVESKHVDEAAALLYIEKQTPIPESSKPAVPPSVKPEPPSAPPTEMPSSSESSPKKPPSSESSVHKPDTITTGASQPLPAHPYPEDTAPVEREHASLRLPVRQYRSQSSNMRGAIIGTQKTVNVQDIALVSTIFEAAKFRKWRNRDRTDGEQPLVIEPSDLRSYRRLPVAESSLLLLIDFTSIHQSDWENAIIPYLRWAYVNRAGIEIIQVGARDDMLPYELKATSISAPSLRSPAVDEALESQPGRATPLAHGLFLAQQVLSKLFQQGRETAHFALFVLVTDGRGNVPLEASQTGEITLPITREGVDDALRIAFELRKFRKVRTILLSPQPQQYAELPEQLATVLGAVVEAIPLREGGAV